MASGRSVVGHTGQVVSVPSVELVDQIMGFAIVAVLPTIFWAGLLLAVSATFDLTIAPGTIVAAAAIAFAFLSGIWACFAVSRSRSRTDVYANEQD